MTVPPERITVKRRRSDAPLDVLCGCLVFPREVEFVDFTDKEEDFERPQKRSNQEQLSYLLPGIPQYHYKLKRGRANRSSPSKSPRRLLNDGIPKVRTIKPGEELNSFQNLAAKKKAEEAEQAKTAAAKADVSTRETLNIKRLLYLDMKTNAHAGKRKRNEHYESLPLAVFVENKIPKILGKGNVSQGAEQQAESSQPATPSRKRPNVRATLSQEATLSRSISRQTLDDDFEKAVQKFADEELSRRKHEEELTTKMLELSFARGPNVVTAVESEDEMDYEYDYYIRCDDNSKSTSNDATKDGADEGVGFLVIEDKDEEYFEAFGEDEEIDENAWDSEQDDENAENWYGADYPEDAIEFDSEDDENPYKYRLNASDNESYGPEDDYQVGGGWDDDEDEEENEDDDNKDDDDNEDDDSLDRSRKPKKVKTEEEKIEDLMNL